MSHGKHLISLAGAGMVRVDGQGRTLYLFKADSGTKSACSGRVVRLSPSGSASPGR